MRGSAHVKRLAALAALLVAAALAPWPSWLGPARAQEAATTSPVVEASMPSMQGHRRLSDERGRRAIVLFYEDRPHVYDNDAFKGELRRYLTDNHLDERVVAYGVANLGDVGMVPEALVRSMVEPAVERWGVDIMLDWDGVMRRPPFGFATDAANVGLVDRQGHLTYRYTGAMTDASRRDFYRSLRGALR
jgi:hypothetical protein